MIRNPRKVVRNAAALLGAGLLGAVPGYANNYWVLPNGDHGPNEWTRDSGSGDHYGCVNEHDGVYPSSGYLYAQGYDVLKTERFDMGNNGPSGDTDGFMMHYAAKAANEFGEDRLKMKMSHGSDSQNHDLTLADLSLSWDIYTTGKNCGTPWTPGDWDAMVLTVEYDSQGSTLEQSSTVYLDECWIHYCG